MDFEALLTRLKTFGRTFSTGQLVSMAGAFVVVVGVIVGTAWWLQSPTYRVLFADLDPESAGRVTARLDTQKVPFQLADGGRSILVPQERIDQLRIDFAVNGLPSSGRMGFEIFDTTQFGATEFLEQVNFRRALEGEVARTIATIGEVGSARVHIALPKERLFGEHAEAAKASVVLKLRSNRVPSASTIQGVAALVAAAVDGLRPESVVIMDTDGRPLFNQGHDSDEPLGAAQLDRQHQYEQQLAKEVVALLEPVVGIGGVHANVGVRLFLASEVNTQELLDPTPVVRSQAKTMEAAAGTGLSQGIAGSRANLPGPVPPGSNTPSPETVAQAATSTTVTNPLRTSETTNFEVGKTTVVTERPRGGVERLTVAVLVDDEHYFEKDNSGKAVPKSRPRSADQIKQLHELVALGIGIDPGRGDQVTVQNIAFNQPVPEEEHIPTWYEKFGPIIGQTLKVLVVMILGIAAFFLVGRPLMKTRGMVPMGVPAQVAGATGGGGSYVLVDGVPRQLPKSIDEIEDEILAELDAVHPNRRLPVLTKRLSGLAQKEPEVAARLVRTWLIEDKK